MTIASIRSHLRFLSLSFIAVLVFATASISAHAQFRTSVQGAVTDSTGAVIPNAKLTLKNNSTNETLVRTSDNAGVFNFNALPADTFTLMVESAGFQKKTLSNLQFIPEQPNALNVQLAAGGTTDTVTVDASTAPALDTETASINATVSSNEIQHLPSAGRDVFQLVELAPGAVSDGSQGAGGGTYNLPGTQSGGGGSGAGDGIFKTENGPAANANGGQFETNGISIDGISTVSAVWGGSSVITPNEDSVASIKIVTNDYDAENGRFSGAQVQVTSKSGTNQIHGSAFFRINRPGLNAYQNYNGPGSLHSGSAADRGLQRDTARFNQFGGSVGGPIWKDKVFAFFAYETIRNDSSSTGTGWYDTPAFDASAPAGSIASKFVTFPGAGVSNATLIPRTCMDAGLIEGVSCNTIAGQGLDIGSPLTSGLGTQDLTYQVANTEMPGVGNGLDGVADVAFYNTSSPFKNTEVQYNGRLDSDVTRKDHLTFAIYWVPVNTTSYNSGARAYNLFHHNAINDAFSLIWNHTFSPNFLNEARANAAGWRWNEVTDNPQSPVGLPADTISGIGNFNLNQFGSGLGSHLNQWTYGYKDVATKIIQNHTIKFGGDFTRLQYLQDQTYNERPSFGFFNIWDFLNDAPASEGGVFNAATGFPGPSRQDDRENLFGVFVQDGWKAKPNLTVNFGIRYSYFGPLFAKQNNLGVVVFGQGANEFTDLSVRQGGGLWQAQKGNFGPQLSFAWSPNGFHSKLVVRGGYGLNFNQEEIAISANGSGNPPGANYHNFGSDNPTSINPNIVYGIPTDVHSLFGYPSNPHTITSFNAAGLPTAGNASLTAFPSNLPTAYAQHYSLDTEYDLGLQLVATVGYEGSVSHHLIRQAEANAIGAVHGLALNPLVTYVDLYANGGASNNNQLLLGLKHQMSHHFSIDANFTLAKSMDDNSGPYSEDPYYPVSPRYAYGRSDFNVGKLFKVYGLWQPVFFHGSHSYLEKIAGNWSLSGIFNIHSGFGWTPQFYTPELYCNSCGYGSLRPNYLGGAGHKTSNSAFEAAANTPASNFPNIGTPPHSNDGTAYTNGYFNVPNYAAALAGNAFPGIAPALPPPPGIARNSFNGPGYRDVDATLTKGFGLPKMKVFGEDARLEIRGDIFNLFNNTNLNTSSIDSNILDANFGQAQQGLGSRTINFQARFSF